MRYYDRRQRKRRASHVVTGSPKNATGALPRRSICVESVLRRMWPNRRDAYDHLGLGRVPKPCRKGVPKQPLCLIASSSASCAEATHATEPSGQNQSFNSQNTASRGLFLPIGFCRNDNAVIARPPPKPLGDLRQRKQAPRSRCCAQPTLLTARFLCEPMQTRRPGSCYARLGQAKVVDRCRSVA